MKMLWPEAHRNLTPHFTYGQSFIECLRWLCRAYLPRTLRKSESVSCSVVSSSFRPCGLYPTRLLCPWDFSRQEYWSGLPFFSPEDLPNPGIGPGSSALQVDSLPSEPPRKPNSVDWGLLSHTRKRVAGPQPQWHLTDASSACFCLTRGGSSWLRKVTPWDAFICVPASFLVSGGFDKTVAIWDVEEGYRKLSLKVPMQVSDRGSEHHSFLKKYIYFICLTVLGLSCSMWDLFFSCSMLELWASQVAQW